MTLALLAAVSVVVRDNEALSLLLPEGAPLRLPPPVLLLAQPLALAQALDEALPRGEADASGETLPPRTLPLLPEGGVLPLLLREALAVVEAQGVARGLRDAAPLTDGEGVELLLREAHVVALIVPLGRGETLPLALGKAGLRLLAGEVVAVGEPPRSVGVAAALAVVCAGEALPSMPPLPVGALLPLAA